VIRVLGVEEDVRNQHVKRRAGYRINKLSSLQVGQYLLVVFLLVLEH
jgi:hypothetical protein